MPRDDQHRQCDEAGRQRELPCRVCELNSVERHQDGRRKANREHEGGKALGVRPVEQVGGTEERRADEQNDEREQDLRHGRQTNRDGTGGLMPVRRF